VTRRAGPRIGYLNSLAARTSGESLRPPHRLFAPVFTDPPAAETPDRAGRATPAGHRQAAAEDIGPRDPHGRRPWPGSAAAPARRAPDDTDRPPAAGAGRPDFGALLSDGTAAASAGAAGPRRYQPSSPSQAESGAARLTGTPPQASAAVTPPRHHHDPTALPHGTAAPPHGAAAGSRRAVDPEASSPAAGQQRPAGHPATDQPRIIPGQPYLSPPTPATAMTGHQTPRTAWAPKPAAGLSIGTIEVTVLPQPAAAPPRPATRRAAARPARTQPPTRLTRGYGPGLGPGQG
jgi:hypothetical protein